MASHRGLLAPRAFVRADSAASAAAAVAFEEGDTISGDTTSIQANKAIARRAMEAGYQCDLATVEELCSPELSARLIPFLQRSQAVFGTQHFTLTDMVAEGDKVWLQFTVRGGHVGELDWQWLRIPPTGKEWTSRGVTLVRLADGKIVEWDYLFDGLSQLRQLGATITPPQSVT
jgi:predicted ester cyclase